MIKYCCFYCQKLGDNVCKEPICYNAFAYPKWKIEGEWYCNQYEGKECGETITNDGKMAEVHKDCWVESDIEL